MGSGDGEAGGLVDRDGNAYAWAQPLRLLDSFDVHLAQRADGSGHAVVEPGSGTVLVTGDTAGGTWDNAQRIAAQLGRRRVQAAIDAAAPDGGAKAAAVSSVPAAGVASWRDLYDQVVHQGSDWETLHHDGGVADHDSGVKRYQGLQDRLRAALVDPATPDEVRLQLANAGYRLYTGANAVGLAETAHVPYSARAAIGGSMGFSGGGAMGPRVAPVSRGRGLLPPTTGNRATVGVEGEAPNVAVTAPQVAGLQEVSPGSGAGGVGLQLPAVVTTRPAPSQAAAESPARGLSPPDMVKVPLRGGESVSGLAGPEQALLSSGEVVRTPMAAAGDEEVRSRAAAGSDGVEPRGGAGNGTAAAGGRSQGGESGGDEGGPQVPLKPTPMPPLSKADFPEVGTKVSNKQWRHIAGHPQWQQDQGGHFETVQHAQDVLDAYHSGEATVLGRSRHGFPVVKLERVMGMNNNRGAGYLNQATNTFMIKGTKSPSVVPVSPEWEKK